jgi:hypothetical protein
MIFSDRSNKNSVFSNKNSVFLCKLCLTGCPVSLGSLQAMGEEGGDLGVFVLVNLMIDFAGFSG